jgi:hypothetical protein
MRLRLGVAGLCLVAGAAPCGAELPVRVGIEFQVSADTTAAHVRPSVSADGTGRFVIVWQSSSGDGPSIGILGQRYDEMGNPQGSQFHVNTYTTDVQGQPSVAMGASGDFVVVWQSRGQDGSDYGVFGRRYDALGSPQGPEFQLALATQQRQYLAKVGVAGDGSFVVAWDGFTQGGSYRGVYGRRFDASGNPQGPDFPLRSSSEGYGLRPTVAMNAAGEFIVAWNQCCDGSGYGVSARRFDPSATPRGPQFAANTLTLQSQQGASVGIDDAGGFVVTWHSAGDVFARRFDEFGSALDPEFLVNTYTTGAQAAAATTMDPDGDFVVVWSSPGQDGSGQGIFGQAFDSSANRRGSEFAVNTYTTGDQTTPAIATDGSGNLVVAWSSYPSGLSGRRGVFGQRYTMPPDSIFADGFETGGLSAWSAAQTDAGDLSVSAGAAMDGTSFGLQALVDDQAGLYVQDDSPDGETRYRARFLLDPSGFDPGETAGHFRVRVFLAFEDAPFRRLVQVILKRQGGQYGLAARVRRDDDSLADTGFSAVNAGPHVVEVDWRRSNGPGAGDGVFEMWIDGASVASLSGLDNDARAVDFVRLGAMSVKSGASGTLGFDEFASRRWTYIGPP